MNGEVILLIVIAGVLVVDFILNGRKKPSIDNVVDQIEGGETFEKKSGNTIILYITIIINILITLWPIFYSDDAFDHQLIEINGLVITYSFLYLINLFLFPFFIYNINFNYILKRKKNLSLSIILILFSKLFVHFFVYTSTSIIPNCRKVGGGDCYGNQNLRHHIGNIFNEEIWLFIPATLLIMFIAWYFNDKIKAR